MPPVVTAATGTAALSLNPTTNLIGLNSSVNGITTNSTSGTGDLTASHIHVGGTGSNGPIVFELGSPGGWVNNGGATGMDLFIPSGAFVPGRARPRPPGG